MGKTYRLFAILYVLGFLALTLWVPVIEYDPTLPPLPAGAQIIDPVGGTRPPKANAIVLQVGRERNGYDVTLDVSRYWKRQGLFLLLMGAAYFSLRYRRFLRDLADFVWYYVSRESLATKRFAADWVFANRRLLIIEVYLLVSIALLLYVPCKWEHPVFAKVYLNRGPYFWESGYKWLWQVKDVDIRYGVLIAQEAITFFTGCCDLPCALWVREIPEGTGRAC